MPRFVVAMLVALFCVAVTPVRAITLEQAMAGPDWVGPEVEMPYWGVDGKAIYYSLKRSGSTVRDLHRVDLATASDVIVDPAMMANADASGAVFDIHRSRAAFARNGDVFLRDLASGRLSQVTRSAESETAVRFSADGRAVQYQVGNDWFVHDIASGVTAPAAIVRAEKNPASKEPDDLGDLQLRLFSTLRTIKGDRDANTANEESFIKGDPTRTPLPFFLGDEVTIEGTSLSTDGRNLLIVTRAKNHETGKIAKLQHYVTESGFEEQEDERVRVGRNAPAANSLWLLDLVAHTQKELSLADLPGSKDDPLKSIVRNGARTERDGTLTADADAKKEAEKPGLRDIAVADIEWSADGSQVAIQLRAIDNKDRWIATVDFAKGKLLNQHRLHDPAWINWNFNDFGWTPDSRTLWYLSEESGYSHLYVQKPGARAKALTSGKFEMSDPVLSADGAWFYLRSNAQAPYSYDVYRVAAGGGAVEAITRVGTVDGFMLSPDGNQLALRQSSSYVPAQLALHPASGGTSRLLTDTRTPEYKAMQWPEVQIVEVPSTHAERPIYSKLYKPADFDASKKYPAVVFVHGAGYLQNTRLGYPNYFREQLFHNLLVSKGYVVLDMDYRASEGYGRDWRTAIYRQMGHPELEDLIDGVDWLVATTPWTRKRWPVWRFLWRFHGPDGDVPRA